MNTPDIHQQQEFYNRYWQDMKPFGRYKQMRTEWIARQLDKICTDRVGKDLNLLDMGCGDGRLTPFWQQLTGAKTSGIELSPQAVATAQALFPAVAYTAGDATHTPYSNDSFDIIICQEVIEHIEQQDALIDEIARILKPGGHLVLTTPNKFYFDHRKGGNYSNQPIENLIDKKDLYRLLHQQFKVLSYETLIYAKGDYGPYRVLTNRYLLGLLRLAGMENSWKRTLLSMGYGLHIAVVCSKK